MRIYVMNVTPGFRMLTPLTTVRAARTAICLATVIGMASPSRGETLNSDPVIAIVNGTQIHQSDVAVVDQMIGRNIPTQDPVERRESVIKLTIDAMLLAKIAKERNIVNEADIERRTTFARNQGLADNLLIATSKEVVTDDSVRKAYDDMVLAAKAEPEVHLRQIFFLVKDAKNEAAVKAAQDKAEAALKRLKDGEDFTAVFADVSDDAAVAARGGDQGWKVRNELGKEIADAAFALKEGEVSPVIKTAAGYHIVKVEEKRDRKPAKFEQIKDRIAGMLASKAQFELIRKARDEAKIERLDVPAASDKAAPKSN
jgi:peptidyl-prolyl cis-trans isomerase C